MIQKGHKNHDSVPTVHLVCVLDAVPKAAHISDTSNIAVPLEAVESCM